MVPLRIRLQIVFGLVCLFVVVYKAIQVMADLNPVKGVNLALPGEELIPFLPYTILIYSLAYVLPLLPFVVIKRLDRVILMVWVFMITTLIHMIIFVAFPVPYSLRPEINPDLHTGIIWLVGLFYQIDLPYNCFPSLHVSLSFLCYFFTRRRRPKLALPVLFIVVAICISTIVLKQHYIVDAIAAFIIAMIMDQWLIKPGIKKYPRK